MVVLGARPNHKALGDLPRDGLEEQVVDETAELPWLTIENRHRGPFDEHHSHPFRSGDRQADVVPSLYTVALTQLHAFGRSGNGHCHRAVARGRT
jgi:hypothetical protein